MCSKFEVRRGNSGLPVVLVVILVPFGEGARLSNKGLWENRRENANNFVDSICEFYLFSDSVVFLSINVGDVSVNWQNSLNHTPPLFFPCFPIVLCAIISLTFVGGKGGI